VKKRVWLAKGYGSFQTAWRTLQGIETVHMIRKGRVRWLPKGDAVGQALFIAWLFGLAALSDSNNQPLCSPPESILWKLRNGTLPGIAQLAVENVR
jgi:hypothetical protein